MKKSKLVSLALAFAFATTMLVGCGGGNKNEGGDKKAAGPSGEVMIYTSIYPDIIDNMAKPAMKKSFPEIDVKWFQGGTEKVVTKISGEIQAKKVSADLLMVADPSYYLRLKGNNLLLNYPSKNAKDVIAGQDKDGAWTAVRISNMVIAYNSDKFTPDQVPQSWKDLTDPKYKGKIAMPNPLLSGTAYVFAGALADKYGWEYFDQLKANGIRVEEGNSAIQNKLLTGEYVAAVILEENILKLAAEKKEPLKVVYPQDGIVMVPSPIGIFASTKNPEAAKTITDWWLSKEGQEAIVQGYMHSVRADVKPPVGAPELKTLLPNAVKTDWDKLSKENAKIKEEFRARVLDKNN